jgi:hypothetical protein
LYGDYNEHYWIRVQSVLDPSKVIYIDDGFWRQVEGERFTHKNRPCSDDILGDPITGYFLRSENFYGENSSEVVLPTIYNSDGAISQ